MQPPLSTLDRLDDATGRSKHEKLRDHVVAEILSGRLRPGQLIPSQRQWVEMLGVAPMTVRQAMAMLESDGLIRRIQGKGTFVDQNARKKLRHGLDVFALIVPTAHDGFYPSLLYGFESAASEIRHQTIICTTHDNVERQADVLMQLLDQNIGGAAINPTSPQPTPAYQIKLLRQQNVPVVFCHRRVEGVAAPLVAIPFREVGRRAGRALVERGHRRAAFVASYAYFVSREYEAGMEEALKACGEPFHLESVYLSESNDLSEADVLAALEKLFGRPDPPTVLFASFDSLAEMIYLLLPRLGLRVPEDVSLIGFGGAWRQNPLSQRITSVVVDEIEAGRKAVALLHEMRIGQRPIDDNEEFVMDVGLSERQTLAPPPAS